MKIRTLLEAAEDEKRLAVVYGGRFQPMHIGHYEGYKWLVDRFGEENVWIATSDKTNFDSKKGDVSPFTFKEKKELMVGLYGIKADRIIKCKNPAFKPAEVFKQYTGFSPVYVSAVGAKDEDRYKNGDFFQKMKASQIAKDPNNLASVDEGTGYFIEMPIKSPDISGTKAREALLTAEGKEREKAFKKYFGKYDQVADQLITTKLKKIK